MSWLSSLTVVSIWVTTWLMLSTTSRSAATSARQGGDLIAARSSDESFDRRHAGRIPSPIASLRPMPVTRVTALVPRAIKDAAASGRSTGRAGGADHRVVADRSSGVEEPDRVRSAGNAGATSVAGRVRRSSASPTPSPRPARSAVRSPAIGSCCGASRKRPAEMRDARVIETSPRLGGDYREYMRRWFSYRTSDFDLSAHRGDIQLDLQQIDLPDASVDVVLTPHVLEHVPDTDKALTRAVPGDRSGRSDVPAGAARLRRPRRCRPSRSSTPTTLRCSSTSAGT